MKKAENCWFKWHKNKFLHLKIVVIVVVVDIVESSHSLVCPQSKT
jgi:hypothetical protein